MLHKRILEMEKIQIRGFPTHLNSSHFINKLLEGMRHLLFYFESPTSSTVHGTEEALSKC